MITNIITQNEMDDITKTISRDLHALQNQILGLQEQINALANYVGAEPKTEQDPNTKNTKK